jgi:hypothetical protein
MTSVQQTPQIFMFVLVICVLASLIIFSAAGYCAIRGQRARAAKLLTRWGLAASVYAVISVGVSLFKPVRVIEQGQNWCFDDWCIAVERVNRTPATDQAHVVYTTDVRIFNAGRTPEGVRKFWVYLRDEADHRYAPEPGSWADVVAARVGPRDFARTSIAFVVPQGVRDLGFVTGHGGGTPCALLPSLLEIGQGSCLFRKPNMIRVE